MIVITGAGGFIGSVVLGYFNQQGIDDIVIFDDLPVNDQYKNLIGKKYISLHSTDEMLEFADDVDLVIHIGADSNTLEKDWSNLYRTNVYPTRRWYSFCRQNNIPFIFTSSAAIYGNGKGPANHYAFSKWVSENEIDGIKLRLFNVYGPNEYHKGRMASVIYHWFQQLKNKGHIEVFENSNYYFRDFIWVEDVAKTIYHFYQNYHPGTYDLGTGTAIDFDKLADIVSQGKKTYIPMPDDLKLQYQTYTQANVSNLIARNVPVKDFLTVEQGVKEYFKYLESSDFY